MPTIEAESLFETMLSKVGLQQEILSETIESAEDGHPKEAGRTICNESSVKDALNRFDRAVELQQCPSGSAAIMHSHVSVPQLRTPEHSLPDIGNVLFNDIDVSMVLGVEEHDVLLAPEDSDAAVSTFQQTIGVEATSTKEVVKGLKDGSIRDYAGTRRRVRGRLPQLFEVVEVDFPELQSRVNNLSTDGKLPAHEPMTANFHTIARSHGHRSEVSEQCQSIRDRTNRNKSAVQDLAVSYVTGKVAPWSFT